MTLWVERREERLHRCEVFDRHEHGNDGLWVIEYDEVELMKKELLRIEEAGVPIMTAEKLSLVVGGGESTADALGYDACGMEDDKRFISVPSTAVRGPKSMPPADKARYMKMAKNKDAQVENLLELVQETSLVGFIEHMQDYQSRNSYSGDNGLDQAADWAEGIFSTFGFAVTRHTFRDDMTAQVVAELPGLEDPDTIIVVGAHYDSRGTQNSSPTQRAPGADDNGSGSAALLEFARVIQESGTRFRHTLRLCLFTVRTATVCHHTVV